MGRIFLYRGIIRPIMVPNEDLPGSLSFVSEKAHKNWEGFILSEYDRCFDKLYILADKVMRHMHDGDIIHEVNEVYSNLQSMILKYKDTIPLPKKWQGHLEGIEDKIT
jgi:hypothetical protein